MKCVTQHKINDSEEVWDYSFSLYQPIQVITYGSEWFLYLCPVCIEVTLEKETWSSEEMEPNGQPIKYEKLIYPTLGTNERYIPKGVKDAFDAALKIRNLDGAIYVLALRRSLEKMCKHKGAVGKDLFSKLKDLQDKKILPEIINELSYILRKEGNSAAHADDREFDQETVSLMIEFTQTILDYVYTLPEKIKKAQERIKKHEPEQEKV